MASKRNTLATRSVTRVSSKAKSSKRPAGKPVSSDKKKHIKKPTKARGNGDVAMLGGKPVSMRLVSRAFDYADPAKGIGLPKAVINPMVAAHAAVAASSVVAPPDIPAIFRCAKGDQLTCAYSVNGAIVAEAALYLAPDANGDGIADRMELIGRSPSSKVSGTTPRLSAGWSYLVWDFHPANLNTWASTLSISVNGGQPFVFGETSGSEASHHQAGMLIWAESHV